MFRLNDAVRRYQAQHRPQPESRSAAASVATPPFEPANLALLIEQLREEGALLQHQENALLIRPTHWQQVDRISPHWKALLRFLQTNENGDDDGTGRSA